MKNKILLISIIIIICLNISYIHAETTIKLDQQNILEDTYISEANPTTNYGTQDSIWLMNLTSYTRDSILKFNISSIPTSATITQSKLYIYAYSNLLDTDSEGYNVSSHNYYNEDWEEDVLTWNNFNFSGYNQTETDSFKFFGGAGEPINTWIEWDVGEIVSAEYIGGNDNCSIYLRSHSKFGSPAALERIELYSKEYTNTSITPYLNITYTLPIEEITIMNPTNNSYSNSENIDLNFSINNNTNLDICIYTIDNFVTNNSINNCENTTINITAGNYEIRLWANTTDGYEKQSEGHNITIDITSPLVENTTINTTLGSKSIEFSFNASDTYLSTCWYKILNSTGGIEKTNTTITCNSNSSYTLSDFGTYNITFYANDTAGNINSTITQFTTSISEVSAGGGGSTVYIQQTIWTAEASKGQENFQLAMAKGETRNFEIEFTNEGEEPAFISFSCEDIVGKACEYVNFPDEELELKLLKDTIQIGEFTIEIPSDAEKGDYEFNIIVTDSNGGQNSITVYLGIGTLGILRSTLSRIFFSTTSFGLNYSLIFFPVLILGFFISSKIYGEKILFRPAFIILTSVTLATIVIYIF